MSTLVILKPDALERKLVDKIIQEILNRGFTIKKQKEILATPEQLKKHYPNSMADSFAKKISRDDDRSSIEEGQKILDRLRSFMCRGPIIVMEITSSTPNLVKRFRNLIGSTNPPDADNNSIREKFGVDSFEDAGRENRTLENLIHASDSEENAKKEINIWFK